MFGMVDAKKIFEQLDKGPTKERVSLYLSREVFDDFKAKCGKHSASEVIEALMVEFIESAKGLEKNRQK